MKQIHFFCSTARQNLFLSFQPHSHKKLTSIHPTDHWSLLVKFPKYFLLTGHFNHSSSLSVSHLWSFKNENLFQLTDYSLAVVSRWLLQKYLAVYLEQTQNLFRPKGKATKKRITFIQLSAYALFIFDDDAAADSTMDDHLYRWMRRFLLVEWWNGWLVGHGIER